MLKFYNTLSRQDEEFIPLQPGQVSMYVCGPTVYAPPHIGNARSVVVYDVLYRLFRHLYGADNVNYVRNITDVDDKINTAARERQLTIQQVTAEVEAIFHSDMRKLNCLPPTKEPHATAHIDGMIAIIQRLIASNHAYESAGHIYFAVESAHDYGKLSGRKLEEMFAGARVEVAESKKHPGDFVLWKPADSEDDPSSVFASPWGKGRPGWHIECSAMSMHFLGQDFDVHGGGADLMFPHHTNEIAQSTCAFPGSKFARYWIHNGFVTVGGEKMSKSLGNFITVQDLLNQDVAGEVVRMVFLMTHYRKPLDWNTKALYDAEKTLQSISRVLQTEHPSGQVPQEIIQALEDDLNVPLALSHLHELLRKYNSAASQELAGAIKATCELLGIACLPVRVVQLQLEVGAIEAYIAERNAAKVAKDYQKADAIRATLLAKGIALIDQPGGQTSWEPQA